MSEPFVGEIRMVGFNYAPPGWAFCDGQIMSIQQNSALFALLGTTYGGNGQTTFGLPDLRGRGAVGKGSGPGLTPVAQGEMSGREAVTLTTAQLPVHTPVATVEIAIPASSAGANLAATPSNTAVLGPVAAAGRAGTLYATDAADTTLKPFNAPVSVASIGGSLPVEIRDPYVGMNFIIALQGIFPAHS